MNEVNKSVKKYLVLFKTYLQTYIYYRANAVIWALFDIIPFIALIIVWKAIYQDNLLVAGLKFNQMISYYLLISLIRELVYTGGGRNTISEEIYSGQLVSVLLKPLSYLKRIFIEEISWRFIQISLFLLPYFLFYFSIKQTIVIVLNIKFWPFVLLSLILAFFISAFLDYLCGIAGFWLVQTGTLFHLKDISYWLLGGLSFPPSLLPKLIQKANLGLPFYYVFAFPVELMTKDFSLGQIYKGLIMQFFWIIILCFSYKILWKKGLKRYESWGN